MSLVSRIHVRILPPSVSPEKGESDTSGLHGFLHICTHNYTAHIPTHKNMHIFMYNFKIKKKSPVASEWQELVQLSQETDWEDVELS